MNDFDLVIVTSLRPEVRLAPPQQLAAARDQLTAVIAAEQRADVLADPDGEAAWAGDRAPQYFPPPGHKPGRRRGWQAAGAIAGLVVAAGVAVALAVGPAAGPPPGPHRGSGPHRQPPVALTAVQWLTTAAKAVARQRTPVPRPGQYIYTVVGQPQSTNNSGAWLSANGRKPGFFGQAGGHGGHIRIPPCPIAAAETGKCAFAAGYVPQMPTSPRALADFLVRVGITTKSSGPPDHAKNWAANALGKAMISMFSSMDLSPRQRAALFKLMAQTRGFVLVKRAVDASGRTGTGIAWTYQEGTITLIFDRHSYAFLGWTAHGQSGPTDRVSLIKQVFVNRPPSFR